MGVRSYPAAAASIDKDFIAGLFIPDVPWRKLQRLLEKGFDAFAPWRSRLGSASLSRARKQAII